MNFTGRRRQRMWSSLAGVSQIDAELFTDGNHLGPPQGGDGLCSLTVIIGKSGGDVLLACESEHVGKSQVGRGRPRLAALDAVVSKSGWMCRFQVSVSAFASASARGSSRACV